MKLFLITINYNGADKTERLLNSLKEQTDQDFEIIIVDNASHEHDLKKLEYYISQNFSSVQLIKSSENLGFSGGNNVAIKKALAEGAEWVVLINNDAWVNSQFVADLRAFIVGHSGIIALPIKEGDRTAYCGRVQWLEATLPHIYSQSEIKKSEIYAIGAGMAVHKSVLDKIGLLDERYFLYFEDADFSVRAHKAGIPIEIAPLAINHEPSSTTSKLGAPLLLRYHWRNTHLFNRKNGSLGVKFRLPFWLFFVIIKQVFKLIFMPETKLQSEAILAGINDFYVRKFGKIG